MILQAGGGNHLERFHAEVAHPGHVVAFDFGFRLGLVAAAGPDLRFDLDLAFATIRGLARHFDAVTDMLREIVVGDERILQSACRVGDHVAAAGIALEAAGYSDLLAVFHLDLRLAAGCLRLRANAGRTHRSQAERRTDELHTCLRNRLMLRSYR